VARQVKWVVQYTKREIRKKDRTLLYEALRLDPNVADATCREASDGRFVVCVRFKTGKSTPFNPELHDDKIDKWVQRLKGTPRNVLSVWERLIGEDVV
jgi:hypothetical protein